MKVTLSLAILALVFASCQKTLSTKEEITAAGTLSSDVLIPLACHSLSLKTDYPIEAGKVPPFSFTKTLYPDSRVKTISMVSRVTPNHQAYTGQGAEMSGTFTYGPNLAYLKGLSKTYTYFHYTDGTVRKVTSSTNLNLKFYFTPQGFCTKVTDLNRSTGPAASQELRVLSVSFEDCCDPAKVTQIILEGGTRYWNPVYDQYGNVTTYKAPFDNSAAVISYTYDYTKPRGTKNFSYIPSQNWFSQEYSLLEVMQWVPQPKHQRKTVAVAFYPYGNNVHPGDKVVQNQVYKNYQFDAKGNQIAVSYGDNISQHTTWQCK